MCGTQEERGAQPTTPRIQFLRKGRSYINSSCAKYHWQRTGVMDQQFQAKSIAIKSDTRLAKGNTGYLRDQEGKLKTSLGLWIISSLSYVYKVYICFSDILFVLHNWP